MPAFTVYLADPYQLNLFRTEISSAVVNLFSQVLPKRGSKERFKYDAIEVRHAPQHIQVMSSELLIYLIESSACSIVAPYFNVARGVSGTTAWKKADGSGSEVYVKGVTVTRIADLIFHEALHNKLQLRDAVLHKKPGTALAKDPVGQSLEPGDINLMKRAMTAPTAQWQGGWKYATDPLTNPCPR